LSADRRKPGLRALISISQIMVQTFLDILFDPMALPKTHMWKIRIVTQIRVTMRNYAKTFESIKFALTPFFY